MTQMTAEEAARLSMDDWLELARAELLPQWENRRKPTAEDVAALRETFARHNAFVQELQAHLATLQRKPRPVNEH